MPEPGVPPPFDDDPEGPEDVSQQIHTAFSTLEELIASGAKMPPILEEDSRQARDIAATGKNFHIAKTPPAAIIKLEALLTSYDHEFLNASKRFENYVTNRILEETDSEDPKVRLKALELLGKRRGVNLFSDQLEVTIKQKPSEEIEDRLNRILSQYINPEKTIDIEDAEEVDPTPPSPLDIDLDKEFGTKYDPLYSVDPVDTPADDTHTTDPTES